MTDPRPNCPACAYKHLAAAVAWSEMDLGYRTEMKLDWKTEFAIGVALAHAQILLEEAHCGYPDHIDMARGWLSVAETYLWHSRFADRLTQVRHARKEKIPYVFHILMQHEIGRHEMATCMAIAHTEEAIAEGNMRDDAPELCKLAVWYIQDPIGKRENLRLLLHEYTKLYELGGAS